MNPLSKELKPWINVIDYQDSEETRLGIQYHSEYRNFSISITDSYGRATNSIEVPEEEFLNFIKKCEKVFFQNVDIVKK